MALSFTITNAGLTAIQQATATNTKVSLTSFQLGTGVNYTPAATQTQLVGASVYSGSVNNYFIQDPNTIVYILQVPLTATQFSWGEVGVYTDGGILFAVASRPTLRTSEQGIATSIQANIVVTNILSVINLPVSNVLASNLSVLPSVDLLQSPVTSPANTYVCKSLSEQGNVIVATAINNNQWQFLGYQSTFGAYRVVAGSTPNSIVSQIGAPLFNGAITTAPPRGSILLQFTSGSLTGTVRRVDWPQVSVPQLNVMGTSLGSTPSPGDQFRLYLSDTYAMGSGLLGATTIGTGMTAIPTVDVLPAVLASPAKSVITTHSLDDTGTAWMFNGEITTSAWHPMSNPMSTGVCYIAGMTDDGYDSTGETQIPPQYFAYDNDTGDAANSFIGLLGVLLPGGGGTQFFDIVNTMVMTFTSGPNAGLVRAITNEWDDIIDNGPQFSSPWPNKINDGDAFVVNFSASGIIKQLANRLSDVQASAAVLMSGITAMPMAYVNIPTSQQGNILYPPNPTNSQQLFAGVVRNPADFGMDTFIYNPSRGMWAPTGGWTSLNAALIVNNDGTASVTYSNLYSVPMVNRFYNDGMTTGGKVVVVYRTSQSAAYNYIYTYGQTQIRFGDSAVLYLRNEINPPSTGGNPVPVTMFLKAPDVQ